MLKDIIKKEIQETITSPKFVFTFLLCTVLILLSVFTGITAYRAEQKEYSAAIALNKKNLESATRYPVLASLGIKINRPPQVLSSIVSGVSEAVGRVAAVNYTYDPSLVDSKYERNPVSSIFGALDLTFIVKIVLGLFAILFTYDLIVGEKERGTLKLILSNGVPRDRLLIGKVVGGYISLIIPLIIPLILGMLILLIYPNISMSGQDWARVLIIFLIFFLYLSVFFTLGLLVSARNNKSSTSFLVLLLIWVIFVMVIPKVSILAAAQLNPIPSVHEITAKKEAFLQQVQEEGIKRARDWSHVHLHLLVTEGGVDAAGVFHKIPRIDDSRLAEFFGREVLEMLVRKELLSPEWAERILSWPHTGFNVHSRVRAKTKPEAERIGKYMIRCSPWSG
jgi:ABC-type transport system involved in multi-copper enzyme maturation permease subunit